MEKLTLNTAVANLFMVGENYAKRLNILNVFTVEDLLYHLPFRYDDLSVQKNIAQAIPGEKITLKGQILSLENVYTRYGKQIQKGYFTDGQQTIPVTWFNQPYLTKTLQPGTEVNLAGTIKLFNSKPSLVSPEYEIIKSPARENCKLGTIHTGRLVPVYPETYGISSKWLRSRIKPLIKHLDWLIKDWLPEEIIKNEKLVPLSLALSLIHFPKNQKDINKARYRLGFDELLLLHLQASQKKRQWQKQTLRWRLTCSQADLKPFISKLPFILTSDQNSALKEIIHEINGSAPMNRLLEGDVGCGKTVVAAAAIFLARLNGLKTAFMAPTEVLANQHLNTLKRLLRPHKIKIGFFTGSKKSKKDLKNYDLFLGTHALLHQNLEKQKIGLVIIDEQHRFGVKQRAKLIGKPKTPHVLTMTATPIPRTIALTLYGNLSLSTIKTMPKGRKITKTWVVPQEKRESAYQWIKSQITKNQSQVFIICPLIDPSDKTAMVNIKAVKEEYKKIKQKFAKLNIGLLHGRLKSKEKEQIMEKFSKNKINALVSTSVIEVGIDVPNASIMVIEGAERFGLAQLHQLRGRVGRGNKQSYCLIFASSKDNKANSRLKALETSHSGIELAKLDLKIRGPGELYGTLQAGFINLKAASLTDSKLIAQTKNAAVKIEKNLNQYPLLQERLKKLTIQDVKPN